MRKVLVLLLLLTNIVTGLLLVRVWSSEWSWEMEMNGMAGYAAAMQAYADFANGVLRQYELVPDENRAKFTGRHDGPFEVWTWPYFPSLGRGDIYATQRFVEIYNLKMRYMQRNPAAFDPHEMGAQPATRPQS